MSSSSSSLFSDMMDPDWDSLALSDESMTDSSFEMASLADEGMTASSSSFDIIPQMDNMNTATSHPNPQTRSPPTVPHLHPRFDRTHPPVVAAEMTRLWREMPAYKQLEALLDAGRINLTEFRKHARNLEQHIRTPPITTAMAPRGSYFAADGSEYTTARFPGYDGADTVMAPSSYHQNNDPFEDLERPSYDPADPQFTMNSATQQAEWNNTVGPVYQHAAVNNTMALAQTPYGSNPFSTVVRPSHQDDGVADNYMPRPSYEYSNSPFNPTATPPHQHAAAVNNMGPTSYQYDNTMAPSSYQYDAAVNSNMAPARIPYDNNAFNTVVTPPHQLAAAVNIMGRLAYRPAAAVNTNMAPARNQYDNPFATAARPQYQLTAAVNINMAPSPPQLPTPRSSDPEIPRRLSERAQRKANKAAASNPPSGSVVDAPHRPSARHQAELDKESPAKRYVPGKVTKGRPGRPRGSKTQKVRYDENGAQIFNFSGNESVGDEFKSSGNLLRLTLHDSKGNAVKGAPKKKIGQAKKDEKPKDKDGKPQDDEAPRP
jgi:hypothetical protein